MKTSSMSKSQSRRPHREIAKSDVPQTRAKRRRRIRPRKPDDYDNERDGCPDSDEVVTAGEIVQWMKALTEPHNIYELWIKKSDKRFLGGYYSSNKIGKVVKDALRHSGGAVGIYWSINPVRQAATHALELGMGAPKDQEVAARRILPIDIDPKRKSNFSATDAEKQHARSKTYEVARFLNRLGWPQPAIVDSGNGFHLLFRVDLPTDDGGLIHSVLRTLQQKFSDEHVEIDTKVANAGRVLKFPGTMACKGEATKERPHRMSRVIQLPKHGLEAVSRELMEHLAKKASQHSLPSPCNSSVKLPIAAVEQARRYIATMPRAVQGERGSDKTLAVATKIVVGFAIPYDSDEARQLLREFSERCSPPWSDKEMRHKLREADRLAAEKGEPRGALRSDLEERESTTRWTPLDGEQFLIDIPDYAKVSRDQVVLPLNYYEKMSRIYGLAIYLVWRTQHSGALIPDVIVRQAHWGAHPPDAWRRELKKKCKNHIWKKECSKRCPLNTEAIRHQHIVRRIEWPNYDLEHFSLNALQADPNSASLPKKLKKHRRYFYDSKAPTAISRRTDLRNSGRVFNFYWPILILGRSPRIGLKPSQVRAMVGITRELTRVGAVPVFDEVNNGKLKFKKASSPRSDRAEIISARKVAISNYDHKIVCPLLEDGQRYVVFGGNLRKHRGCGYRIAHDNRNCWLTIAGYGEGELNEGRWKCVRNLLSDFVALSAKFDLIVAGRHQKKGEWKSLSELQDCLLSGNGQDWLDECTLRIFAPADYLLRWRYFFSKQLGFSWIPGGEPCPFSESSSLGNNVMLSGGSQLRALLNERDWTTQALADRLRCSRKTVSRHLSGERDSAGFWDKVNKLAISGS